MRKILLLGGYGFVGTNILHYIDKYEANKFQVIVFDKSDRHPENLNFACISKSFLGDLSNTASLEAVFDKNKFDMIIYAVGLNSPLASDNIGCDLETELKSMEGLLQVMVKSGNMDIIFMSSGGAIYGYDGQCRIHKETDVAVPISSYGLIKLAVEEMLYQYYRDYGLRPICLRVTNLYGPYHSSNRQGVINIAIRSAINHTPFTVWGDGGVCKDYIYIEDCIRIIMQLIGIPFPGMIINVGSGDLSTVNTILEYIKELLPDLSYKYTSSKASDIPYSAVDISKLRGILPNIEFTSLRDGIFKSVEWQLKNHKNKTKNT